MNRGLLVAAGSGLGGCLRYFFSVALEESLPPGYLWPFLIINIAGALLIGIASARLDSPAGKAFWMAGFCGGFTTFSFFSLETILLIEAGDYSIAGMYSAATLVGSVAAVGLGQKLAVNQSSAHKQGKPKP